MKNVDKLKSPVDYATEKMRHQGHIISILSLALMFVNGILISLASAISKDSIAASILWGVFMGLIDAKILKVMRKKVLADSIKIFVQTVSFFAEHELDISDKEEPGKRRR